jgi:hypothetical protein
MGQFKVPSSHLLGRAEENHEKLSQESWFLSQDMNEPDNLLKTQSEVVITSAAMFSRISCIIHLS